MILRDLATPVTAKELADAGAGQRRTVDRHLSKLESHGLAVKTGTHWVASGDISLLDQVALDIGATQAAELQKARYERNRAGFRLARGLDGPQSSERPRSDRQDATTEHLSGRSDAEDGVDVETVAAEEEFQRWYEEQLLLEQLGLPSELT